MILLMATKKIAAVKTVSALEPQTLTRLTRTIYFMLIIYIGSLIVFDSGNLITRDAVIDHATVAFVVLVCNTFMWYAAAEQAVRKKTLLVYALSFLLIAFAGFNTYWERGMESNSTILYALPLLAIATLKNRHALMATAVLCAGTYSYAAIRYFNTFFNEGFRIQLWGTLLLISGSIFVVAWLITVVAGLRRYCK